MVCGCYCPYHFLHVTGVEAISFHPLYQEEESNPPEAFGLVVEAEGVLVVGLNMVLAVIRTYGKAVQMWGLKRTLEKMYSVRKEFYVVMVTVVTCGGSVVVPLESCC